jgi:hypothetical protein
MGVQEYFAYDPNIPPIRRSESYRLFGWQLDNETGLLQKMTPGPGGRLWSRHLDSLLVPDGAYLRLHDREGHLRLTQGEADRYRAEAEAQGRQFAERRAETEAEARRFAERRAEVEAEKARRFAEKLRSLGLDPEQLL